MPGGIWMNILSRTGLPAALAWNLLCRPHIWHNPRRTTPFRLSSGSTADRCRRPLSRSSLLNGPGAASVEARNGSCRPYLWQSRLGLCRSRATVQEAVADSITTVTIAGIGKIEIIDDRRALLDLAEVMCHVLELYHVFRLLLVQVTAMPTG